MNWEAFESHPSRVRGLKLCTTYPSSRCKTVAPFTGAWIETVCLIDRLGETSCRTLHGCVD